MKSRRIPGTLATLLLLGGLTTQTQAVVLDWDTVTWTSGSLTNSYDIDPSFAGNDIRITVTKPAGTLMNLYPRVANDLTGGKNPAENALRFQLDLPNQTNFISVTIDFLNPMGVYNPTFSIYDLDVGPLFQGTNTWQDQVRNLQASFGVITYTPTITDTGSTVSVNGNTLTGVNLEAPNNSANGNATVSFNAGPVTQIKFDYGSGTGTMTNPNNQGIAFSDLSYNNISGVPEINGVWICAGALVLAAGLRSLRKTPAQASA